MLVAQGCHGDYAADELQTNYSHIYKEVDDRGFAALVLRGRVEDLEEVDLGEVV